MHLKVHSPGTQPAEVEIHLYLAGPALPGSNRTRNAGEVRRRDSTVDCIWKIDVVDLEWMFERCPGMRFPEYKQMDEKPPGAHSTEAPTVHRHISSANS